MKKVLVLVNPKSGAFWSFGSMLEVIRKHWDHAGNDLFFQFSNTIADGQSKVRRALERGVDTVLVVGGDGMVNSVGAVLVDSEAVLGVIPVGSGNGFARHFNIPLKPEEAVRALVGAIPQAIDVGVVNGRPFFVTCSMAWDAALVRTFEKSPVRGIASYFFAAVSEYITYEAQPIEVRLDDGEALTFKDPVVFTAANLTQFGVGARIAPRACPDDGHLELVVILRSDMPGLLPRLHRLFDGTLDSIDDVVTRRFRRMQVRRRSAGPVQVDGEVWETGRAIEVTIKPRALRALVVPSHSRKTS